MNTYKDAPFRGHRAKMENKGHQRTRPLALSGNVLDTTLSRERDDTVNTSIRNKIWLVDAVRHERFPPLWSIRVVFVPNLQERVGRKYGLVMGVVNRAERDLTRPIA